MRTFYILVILFIFLPLMFIQSCAKAEDENNENPQISEVFFNLRDTIHWNGEVFSINNNNTLDDVSRMDTLPIEKMVYVRARFDDMAKANSLSGYLVVLDSIYGSTRIDSVFRFSRQGGSIFGKSDTLVERNNLTRIPFSFTKNQNGKIETFYTYQGDYSMKIVCGNTFGRRDSLIYTVKVLSRDSIYKIRKGIR